MIVQAPCRYQPEKEGSKGETAGAVVRTGLEVTVRKGDLREAAGGVVRVAGGHAAARHVREPAVVYRSHEGNLSRALVEKAADQARVLSHWWRRRHLLAPRERRLLRRELARRLRRHARRLRREGSSA